MADLLPVYDELHRRLTAHADGFATSDNLTDANVAGGRRTEVPEGTEYVLLGAPTEKYPDGLMFAAVKLGRRYVSYYLMPVYLEPTLLEGISPELRRRMQGKSCFNFTRIDRALFDELEALTARGSEQYAAHGWLREP